MDSSRYQESAGKRACEAKMKTLSEIAGFDDDGDWSDDLSANDLTSAISAARAKEQELSRTSLVKKSEMEVVSPLVRSIFEGRKKSIINAGQKGLKKDQAGWGAQPQIKPVPQRDHTGGEYEKSTLSKKVLALDEEIAIFKKESKRVKNLAKEHEEGLTRLAREKAEWEQQKKCQMQAFQAQQEEQVEKLKKERQVLDHRSVTLNIMPAVQRKDLEEMMETLAKEREEHRGKEMRLRLTINRLKAMNEDLTKQVLEMQDEIRRYEGCLLSALHGRENGSQTTSFSKRPCGEANHKHSCTPPKQPPPEALRGVGAAGGRTSKFSRPCSSEENSDTVANRSVDGEEHHKSESSPKVLIEQAKLLSNLFSQPWKAADWKAAADCAVQEDLSFSRYQTNPKLADWR